MAEVDKACCSLPAVTTHDYKPKGTYEELAGLRVYITTGSPSTITRGLIGVYDIFGLMPQTIQGADLLAESLKAVVLVPDFFKGEPLPLSIYPPNTEEKKKMAGEFIAGTAEVGMNTTKLLDIAKEAREKYGSVEGWGTYGLCWGGKVTALASGPGTPFKASGTAHPGRLAKEDAEKLTIPYCCLFSKEDGTPELVKEYEEVLRAKKVNEVETYGSMHHGWMGARANFESEENVKEFERG
ncbi:hypothetical protein MMC28_002935 [Mycoblastus sanguinarius]|nr:hypothetical protein [Mycoblastus sanguinarius]